jgi:hypothetical protein
VQTAPAVIRPELFRLSFSLGRSLSRVFGGCSLSVPVDMLGP